MIITTNIRLPEDKLKALKLLAVHSGTTVSALLREAVEWLLQQKGQAPIQTPSRSETKHNDPFFSVIGLGAGGPSDDSTRHDAYLYGRK
jgi:antitoxin-like ribbon-helix-helix protein